MFDEIAPDETRSAAVARLTFDTAIASTCCRLRPIRTASTRKSVVARTFKNHPILPISFKQTTSAQENHQ